MSVTKRREDDGSIRYKVALLFSLHWFFRNERWQHFDFPARVMFNNSTYIDLGLGSRVRILEGFGLTLVFFISLMLNISVCVIIWTTKPLLAKPSNILVGNLCIANLLLTACGIPFSLVTIIKDQHDAYSHSILCQVWRNLKKIRYFHFIKEIWKATVGETSIFFKAL